MVRLRVVMKILISGASGLIGSALCEHLSSLGYQVGKLRRVAGPLDPEHGPCWNIDKSKVEFAGFADCDVIIHLAGESIATGRWTSSKRQRIMDSRVDSTHVLAMAIASRRVRPSMFVCASAIGFYGDRGDELLDESSPPGDAFVSKVVLKWEDSCTAMLQTCARIVNLRTGIVLSNKGGALGRMLLPFKFGLGGIIGNGKQYVSWITMEDFVRGVHFIIEQHAATGPINMVSPNPVTNFEFTKALGKALRRPTVIPMPELIAKAAFGQMAEELLLSSTKVNPTKLQLLGFEYAHPHIDEAMVSVLKSSI